MNIQIASSSKPSPRHAVHELREQLRGIDPQLLVFFASSRYAPAELARDMKDAFPRAAVMGCTTAGEIISGKMLNHSVVGMAMDGRIVQDASIEVLHGLKEDCSGAVTRAFSNFERHFGTPMRDLDFSQYVGLVLADGLSGMEERLMDRLGDLTNLRFVGGSAGDDLAFKQTHVFAEGKAYADAAILCVLKPAVAFDVLKTQSFRILDKHLVATKVDEANRQVFEFNHEPAVQAYAKAVGIEPSKIAEAFMSFPLGLIVDGEPYVRSPQRQDGSSLRCYCNVVEGAELSLLESSDIVHDTQQALAQKQKDFGPISGIINFHCILRTLALQKSGQLDAYGKLFERIPTIGFSTYGEQYLGHVNQTSTMLLLGEPGPEQ